MPRDQIKELLDAEAFWREIVKELQAGGCWCSVGIGNPMMGSHSALCMKIQAAMETK